ncbi:Uncharacterised protein [Klebsiella pneumoniae]|nr:Uncharacterised protein [Klebsiella pneumoniae]
MQTMLPDFLRPHGGDNRLRHQQRAAQANIKHRVIVGALDIHQLQRLGNPGVIDQYINPTVFRQDLFDGRLHLHFISDVGRQAEMAFANAAAAVLLASPLRSIMTTFAPFSANNFAVAKPGNAANLLI